MIIRRYFAILTAVFILCICTFAFISCTEGSTDTSDTGETTPGGESKPVSLDLSVLREKIAAAADLSNTEEYSTEQIQTFYGIEPDMVKNCIVLRELDVLSAEVLILAEAVDLKAASDIVESLKSTNTYKLNELRDYNANPDNERMYYEVERAEIITEGVYVFMAIDADDEAINKAIRIYIKEAKG
ncbi:hypothetical protein FACS1894219_08850 [Clostridia bacterium]|nr:hypothetical protein FACS1894219_08850 [Clostridia bacterium]